MLGIDGVKDVLRQRRHLIGAHRHTGAGQRIAEPFRQGVHAGVVQIELAALGLAECIRQNRLHGVPVGIQHAFALAVGLGSDLNHVDRAIASQIRNAHFAFYLLQHGGADLIVLRRVGEFHLNQRTLLKIDTVFEPALQGDAGKPSYGQHQRGNDEGPFLAEKVVVCVFE